MFNHLSRDQCLDLAYCFTPIKFQADGDIIALDKKRNYFKIIVNGKRNKTFLVFSNKNK
jgi:hypothetical protein